MEIWKEFTFDAAHHLPRTPADHKCHRMHGHTYRLRVYLSGEPDQTMGWIVDFADVKKAVKPVIDRLDHHCLNDVEGLENPTTEVVAAWLWEQLEPALPQLVAVELAETGSSGVLLRKRPQ